MSFKSDNDLAEAVQVLGALTITSIQTPSCGSFLGGTGRDGHRCTRACLQGNWKKRLGVEVEWLCGCCQLSGKDGEMAKICRWKDECMVNAAVGKREQGKVAEVSAAKLFHIYAA